MADDNVNDLPDEGLEPNPAPMPPEESPGIDAPGPIDLEPPAMPEPESAAPASDDVVSKTEATPEPVGGYPPPPPPPPAAPSAPQPGYAPPTAPPPATGDKSKIVAGVLGILLGWLGIHKFYLGYVKEGLILAGVTLITFGTLSWVSSLVGLVEGIIYLTKTDEEFRNTYVVGRKPWF